ncbi:two-component sensor histidine kinase [Acrocarpospora corrugata]|uniref:histidine kinase n=1 Tax=Acrocarpospora corrugata TaxID=35763 RepID=A0A5M3W5X9_9ACTN|nr:ATP-binding protein [Acrocarpospora corrugata]GES04425.1 two-component sensor histidine kinase [Acrocarpospora corrugata]
MKALVGGWSLRVRATVVATLVVAVALAAAAVVLTGVLRGSLVRSATDQASLRMTSVMGHLAVPAIPVTPAVGLGTTTATNAGVALDPDVQVLRPGVRGESWTQEGYIFVTETVDTKSGPLVVSARASLQPTEQALAALRTLLIFGIPALLLLVAVLTWLFMSKALVPVSGITAKLADITARDLHQRVPVPVARDEINALARTVNATLDRLETAVEHHKRFVADAAHELRSPIATLRTRLELGERAAPELARESLTDVTRLQTIAADLLLLARLDAGEPLRTEEVDLGQLATEEALRLHPQMPIFLEIAPDVLVKGSPTHLTRVITNLLGNALRHADSTITVRLTADATLDVIDDGPGIPPEHRESVFDRFTRLDEARDRDAGGAGLGLAIAREIAHAHGGTLTVADTSATCLRLRLKPL